MNDEHNDQDPMGQFPLLNDHPPLRDWYFTAEMHGGRKYRVTVTARYRDEACRHIVHEQMAKGIAVRRIADRPAY